MSLVQLLKQPEGKSLEFKRDLSSPDGALRSIVAFANTAGGALIIGVEDKTRHVCGVKEPLSHDDAVYRVLQHLNANQTGVPHFPLIVVDEYQDFNPLEIQFIDLLAESSSVLIAGDDDQDLYGFKHASPTYIRDFGQGRSL